MQWLTHELVIKAICGVFVIVVVGAFVQWSASHPNRRKNEPGVLRLPKFIAFVGWAFIVVGVMIGAASLTAAQDSAMGMTITFAAMTIGGIAFVAMYRNYWLIVGMTELRQSNVWGHEKRIRYDDIEKVTISESNGITTVTMRTPETRIAVNASIFDLSPAIDRLSARGVWPD